METIGQRLNNTMPKRVDLTGKIFGKLTVIELAEIKGKHTKWNCRCSCGGRRTCYGTNLVRGLSESCGCILKETNRERLTTHGHCKGKETSTYNIWLSMKARTVNKKCEAFVRYGGSKILMCDEWLNSFEAFLHDMGERPEGMSLDRIDNSKGYYKDNCRWATPIEQANNKRNNRLFTFKGKSQTLAAWGRELGINIQTLRNRYYSCKWDIEKILTTPVKSKNNVDI